MTTSVPVAAIVVVAADEAKLKSLVFEVRHRFATSSFSSLDDALRARHGRPPRAFVCDLDGIDHGQVRARLKRLGQSGAPVLVVASALSEAAMEGFFRAGVADLLLRPFSGAELRVKLARWIARRKARIPGGIPRRIGPYILQEPIGRGGTSAVFRAWHVDHPDDDLALKLIWPHLADDSETIQRFRREIVIMQNLDHESLVRFIASGRHGDWFFYVMEHLQGGTLRSKILEGGRASPKEALELLANLAEPLRYLHRQGLIHRDIKPENIYMNPRGLILGDFGLAKQFTDRGITLEDDVIGTPLYIPPEAFKNSAPDRRADIYAAGMCAFEWLNGGPVLRDRDPVRLIARISNEGVPGPRELLPELAPEIITLLESCLAPEPNDRIADADTLGTRARALLDRLTKSGDTDLEIEVAEDPGPAGVA